MKDHLNTTRVAIIVAHPIDETPWVGGTLLSHPSWHPFIVCLSGANDLDRASRFYNSLDILKI